MIPCKDCGKPAFKPLCIDCFHARSRKAAAASEHITGLRWKQAVPDAFHRDKFDEAGDVRPHWSFELWIKARVADIPKTPSPQSMTAA